MRRFQTQILPLRFKIQQQSQTVDVQRHEIHKLQERNDDLLSTIKKTEDEKGLMAAELQILDGVQHKLFTTSEQLKIIEVSEEEARACIHRLEEDNATNLVTIDELQEQIRKMTAEYNHLQNKCTSIQKELVKVFSSEGCPQTNAAAIEDLKEENSLLKSKLQVSIVTSKHKKSNKRLIRS